MNKIIESKTNCVDLFKVIAAILIVGSHCLPIVPSEMTNYLYGQWLFRFCVPFFFISTGYFFSKMDKAKKVSYLKRIILLYIGASFLYFTLFIHNGVFRIIYTFIFGYHHLWYLSALCLSLALLLFLDKIKNKIPILWLLLAVGVLLDEYYKLLDIDIINRLASAISYIGGPRHALFFALPMLLVGEWIGKKKHDKNILYYLGFFGILMIAGLIEVIILNKKLGYDITTDVTIFGWMPAIPLFIMGLKTQSFLSYNVSRKLRKVTDWVYILHVWSIVLIEKILGIEFLLKFGIVLFISFAFSIIIVLLMGVLSNIKRRNEASDFGNTC